MTTFYAIYLTACAVIFLFGVHALYKMTRQCSHVRRVAFVLTSTGAAASVFEAMDRLPPAISAILVVTGMAMLHVVGSRELGRWTRSRA